MAESCKQEGVIGEIRATLQFFKDAEERREMREERMATAMETVAAQGKTLEAHAENLKRHDKNFENIFGRVRELEIAEPKEKAEEKRGLVIRILESKAGPYVLAVIVIGFTIDCITNYELVKKMLGLFK